jgi:transposase
MFLSSEPRRILACREPVDMRKSFDGLVAAVQRQLDEDPLSGTLFVFSTAAATT